MGISIHSTFLPHDDPDVSPAFHRDTPGFDSATRDVSLGNLICIQELR